jgi:single-strand DNA-binding protein
MLNLTFTGNVGNDPEMKYTSNGDPLAVTTFSVAINNGKTADGQDRQPTWVRVTVWRGLAEIVAQYVKKGDKVTITANQIKANAWTDKQSGEARASIEVTAREVDFSGNRREEHSGNGRSNAVVTDDSFAAPRNPGDIPF